jgi:DNA-binding response OmpR family regulator
MTDQQVRHMKYSFGGVLVDEEHHEIRINGIAVKPGERPLRTLFTLLRAAGRLVTKDDMAAAVWPDKNGKGVACSAIEKAVSRVRLMLPQECRRRIVPVRGRGWRFDCGREPPVQTDMLNSMPAGLFAPERGRPAATSDKSPAQPEELPAGMRRRDRGRTLCVWTFGTAEFDELSMTLCVNGMPSPAGARSLAVLCALLRAGGQPVSRDQMITAVWGADQRRKVSSDALERLVERLRLGLTSENREYIQTVRDGGWRFAFDRLPKIRCRPLARMASKPAGMRRGQAVPGSNGSVLEELLGRSPGAEVWASRAPADARAQVCKLVTDDAGRAALRLALTQYLQLQQRLGDRADIVRVESWNLGQLPCSLTCEHAGQNLASWAAGGDHLRPMRLAERLRIFFSIAEPVAAAHNAGVLHRALTPGNILVSRGREGWQVRVADFGSSSLLEHAFLKRGQAPDAAHRSHAPGSAYLAPELRDGRPMTQQSDVYSLGVILQQLIAGDFNRMPGPGWSEGIDPAVCEVIAAATHPDPARRTATVDELIGRLRSRVPAAAQRPASPWIWAVPGTGTPADPQASPAATAPGAGRPSAPRLRREDRSRQPGQEDGGRVVQLFGRATLVSTDAQEPEGAGDPGRHQDGENEISLLSQPAGTPDAANP